MIVGIAGTGTQNLTIPWTVLSLMGVTIGPVVSVNNSKKRNLLT